MTDFKRTNKKQARVGKRPKIRVYNIRNCKLACKDLQFRHFSTCKLFTGYILSRVLTTYCAVFYLSFISQRLRQSLKLKSRTFFDSTFYIFNCLIFSLRIHLFGFLLLLLLLQENRTQQPYHRYPRLLGLNQ